MPLQDERWSRYPETVLHFAGEPEIVIDLRQPVSPAARKALAGLGLAGEFGVLTASNPHGVDSSDDENSLRLKELVAELDRSGDAYVRIEACSPDKSHCEHSIALRGSRDRTIHIAKRWEQIAIFWWDGASFWIYGAVSDSDPIQLPL